MNSNIFPNALSSNLTKGRGGHVKTKEVKLQNFIALQPFKEKLIETHPKLFQKKNDEHFLTNFNQYYCYTKTQAKPL